MFFFFEKGYMHVLISLLKKEKEKKRGVLGGTKQDLEFWKTLKALP